MNVTPTSGWYDDPDRPGWLRRWNGSQWVDEWVRSPATPPPTRRRRTLAMAASLLSALVIAVAGVAVWAARDGQRIERPPTSGSSGRAEPVPASGSTPDGGDQMSDQDDDATTLLERCGRPDVLTIPGTDISIEPMSPEQERAIGAETRSLVLRQYRVSDDLETQALLDRLLDEVRPTRTDLDLDVTLLESSEVNAFAIPGGNLFFTSGITSLMTDDELTFVMSHEVGHAICRHLARKFEREALVAAGLDALLGSEIDTGRLYAGVAATVLNDIADLGFSREDELESDLAALDLLDAAGRPLDAGPSALRVLQNLEGDLEPSEIEVFFSTHPPTSERIAQLEAEIAQR